MESKKEFLMRRYVEVMKEITGNEETWKSFLTVAGRNFRLEFDEQILIYAQKPDATAVLSIEKWNRVFHRWVNKGTKSITVFEDGFSGSQKLKYYFDVSDTHEGRNPVPVPIWEMKKEYEEDVIAALESVYGDLERKDTLSDAIVNASENAAEDNLDSYLEDLIHVKEGSFLEDLDDENLKVVLRDILSDSLAYVFLKRLNKLEESKEIHFPDLSQFNRKETLEVLGYAVSDISEMGLTEVSRTILKLDRENRTIAEKETGRYNAEKEERREEHERDNLHETGRLSVSRSDSAGAGGTGTGSLRKDEVRLSENEQKDILQEPVNQREAVQGTLRDRTESNQDGRRPDEEDERRGRNHGGTEEEGYASMGSEDEQFNTESERDSSSGSDLRLEVYEKEEGPQKLPFLYQDDIVREILRISPHLKEDKEGIKRFYESNQDEKERTEYIKGIFNLGETVLTLKSGELAGYKAYDNVLHLWRGEYEDRKAETYYDWVVIARYFETMRLLGELKDDAYPLPSVNEQINTINRAEPLKDSAFLFPQEFIDAVLTRGSGVSEGKYRIYEQFMKSLSKKENIDFLKNEYGWGGASPVLTGSGIGEDHDGKGIRLSKGYSEGRPELLLPWKDVEKRLSELIKMDRYLNRKEKEYYPVWLEKQEARREEVRKINERKEILNRVPEAPEKERTFTIEVKAGDRFFMGAGEYEVAEITPSWVRFFDVSCPLIAKEMNLDTFLDRIKESPENERFRKYDDAEKTETEEEKLASDIIDFLKESDPYEFENNFEDDANDENIKATYLEVIKSPEELKELTLSIREMIPNMDNDPELLKRAEEILRRAGKYLPSEIPAGAIEYLGTNGEVVETEVFTDAASFEETVKDRNYYGIPMNIILYEDDKGNTVKHDFIYDLDPMVGRVKTIPYEGEEAELETAKELIKEYLISEFEEVKEDTFDNLESVGLAYTETEDGKHEIEVKADLVNFKISQLLDGEISKEDSFSSLKEMNEKSLSSLDFSELTIVPDDDLIEELPEVKEKKIKRDRLENTDLYPGVKFDERHQFDLKNVVIDDAGKKERFDRNVEAINILKTCEKEERYATPKEQEKLAMYAGWGGIPEAFDDGNPSWSNEYRTLKNLLNDEEYESARESTLTAFYTPPVVINAVYKALENMGLKEGNILEPSCGTGNFIGMLPESMKESKIYGIELDHISSNIARQLYQKSSIAANGFENVSLPDSFFDAVVGNVPFGDFKVQDKRYDKHNFLIHDYFFARSLDKVRPGGVIALVTSKGTMDKQNPKVRKYISERAELLGAIRLPNDTFKGNAGTEVVSDILFLKKRDRMVELDEDWINLSYDNNGNMINSYFVNHPEMILGEMKKVSGRFGETLTCEPYEDIPLESQLEEAISNIHGEITAIEIDEDLEEDNSVPADPSVRNFSFTEDEGKIYYRENSRMTMQEVSATAENRIRGMIKLRTVVRELIELQSDDASESEIKEKQAELNLIYDNFTKKYGLINSRANKSAFDKDSSYCLLAALENLDDEGNLESKADMFFKRTIRPHVPVTSVDTASEALAVSLGEKAKVNMEYMSNLSGKTEDELYSELEGVIFINPLYVEGGAEEKYVTADEYLSGNVREKLRVAENAERADPVKYRVNVDALTKAQPEDLSASEISVRLGATWIPPEIVDDYIFTFLETPRYAQWGISAKYSPYTGEWSIEGKSNDKGNVKAYVTYGTDRINAYKIIEETLNLKDVRIFDYIEDNEGKRKAVLNKKETAIAQAKQELIKEGFKDWIWSDPVRRDKLTKMYNELFNSIRPREYDGSHILFSNMNPEITLMEHQKNAVAHILYGGNTLLAHTVGAGKTYEMAAAAMEMKRLGLCNKSLFVVPNHLTEQWGNEFLQLYPSANILVATKKDFTTKNRKKFCGRIATGDYDAVIIGHSQFEKIPMSVESQRNILEKQLEEIVEGIAEAKRLRGNKFTVKQLEKTKKTVMSKLDKLNAQSRKDDVVTFEELGVDRLFVDESHYFKNLFLYTKMRNVGGIAQTEAQKSSDLFMKCRYLDSITGGRGTVFATGTPISNSMVELYTIQRYLQYNTLEKHNLQHFDAWASTFGETITAVELTPEGSGYRAKTRFAKFYNLPELMSMFKEVADIKTADMLNLPVPDANYHNIAVKPSDMQREIISELSERADRVRSNMVNPSVDNMLKITNDGRKLALDQRIVNPLLPDFEDSKVNACIDNMYRIWNDNKEKKSTQLFFSDLSTPKKDGSFNVYDDVKAKLIERGIPEEEIQFIHDADTETKKQEVFKKVRKGDVRILMGSTQKMGAGTNVQDKLIAIHNIDCPWRPSDLEQRTGRIVRQGNENPEVDIYRYVTEETFDAYLYQLVEGKQKFASQIMSSKSPVRSCEDIDETALSYAEIKMLATGNPYIKEKMDLDIQVQKLKMLKSNFLSEKYALEDKVLKYYPGEITRKSEIIESLKLDKETALRNPKSKPDSFIGIEIQGIFYGDKEKAGNAVLNVCKSMTSPDAVPLGKYRGFDADLFFDSFSKEYKVKFKGEISHIVTLGSDIYGNFTRMDNVIDNIPDRLEKTKAELENVKLQLKHAETDIKKEFPDEEKLQQKLSRLNELNALLNVDKSENEIIGDEEPEDEKEKDKEKEMER